MRRYGEEGARLWRLARGIDARRVDPERDTKSISAETTFERDIGEFRPLEQTSVGADRKGLGAAEGQRARRLDRHAEAQERRLQNPHARAIASARRPSSPRASSPPAANCCAREVGTTRFRLIGIGVSHLEEPRGDDLADLHRPRAAPRPSTRSTGCAGNSAATRW